MTAPHSEDRWEAELRMLRQELSELRTEQRELTRSVQQLATTFRNLATHLGIAAEPYARKGKAESDPTPPGFG